MVKKLDFLIAFFMVAIVVLVVYILFLGNNTNYDDEIILLNKTELTITVNEKSTIKVIDRLGRVIKDNVKWQSNDINIVTVDNNGNVYGKAIGDAIIVVKVGGKITTCKVKVIENANENKLSSIIVDKKSITIEIGKKEKITAYVKSGSKKIKWISNNTDVLVVDKNGVIEAKKTGVATVSAINEEDGKNAICYVTVKKKATTPIVPYNYTTKYVGTTLKYYIQNNTSHYLTYIWMDDPYNQIKKLESTVAEYGKIMTDDEMTVSGKKSLRKTVGEMMNAYISNGMISSSKAAIAFNGSGFFDKRISAWKPVSDYYDQRSNSWFSFNDGILVRNRIYDDVSPYSVIIGISPNGELKVYDDSANTSQERIKKSNKIIDDKIKNTWNFTPVIIKNGKVVTSKTSRALRNAICQIDSNNYVMYTSIQERGLKSVGETLKQIGCVTAFNLDGGGSTSMFYKEAGSKTVQKVKCSEGNKCRAVVDGIYFIEK